MTHTLVPKEPTEEIIYAMEDAYKATRVSGVSGQTIEAAWNAAHAKMIAAYKAAIVAAISPDFCYECGGTYMLGPVCLTCNPEMRPDAVKALVEAALRVAKSGGNTSDHMTACEKTMGTTHPCTCGATALRTALRPFLKGGE